MQWLATSNKATTTNESAGGLSNHGWSRGQVVVGLFQTATRLDCRRAVGDDNDGNEIDRFAVPLRKIILFDKFNPPIVASRDERMIRGTIIQPWHPPICTVAPSMLIKLIRQYCGIIGGCGSQIIKN